MPLRRFQPISRFGQWRETVQFRDPRTGQPADLTRAFLTIALYRDSGQRGGRWDYGRLIGCDAERPVLIAATNDDNTGIFRKIRGGLAAQFLFPQPYVARLKPGSYVVIATATIFGQTDEILRETIVVLPGGPAFGGYLPQIDAGRPFFPAGSTPLPSPTPSPSANLAVATMDYLGSATAGQVVPVLPISITRRFLSISNTGSNALTYRFGADPTATAGHGLAPGDTKQFDPPPPQGDLRLFSSDGTTYFVTAG